MNQAPVLSNAKVSAHSESRINRKFGFWLFLSSELLIFCGLIGGFLVTKHYAATWPTQQQLTLWLASLNTFLLLTSSLTVVLGIEKIQANQSRNLALFLVVSALLGFLFLCGQAYEYQHLIFTEKFGFGDPFGTAFFILTGLHGLHVFVGVLWALTVAMRARRGTYSSTNYTTVEMFGLYWHFVDLVWILIFTIVYLI
ncbi:MAG: cytochrome c oxidase subunit 3 [Gammaproteobacteria bacterium]|nr:cytochrome c oxidase subunit 3 [Gammaproteobacteria bacterium]